MQDAARLDWDDLKCFVAIARHGSTIAAGRALRVDPSTVQRRLAALERAVGQPLARRTPTGYRLTGFGESMLEHAERVDRAVETFAREVAVRSREAIGVVRVTCPEPIVVRMTRAGLIDRFHARHPRLRIEFVASDRYLDLAKGEVDVALRSGDTDDEGLVGRRIGDSLWAVYGSRDYVERHGRPASVAELASHALIGLDDSMAGHRTATWLRSVAPDASFVARNGSVLGLVSSARSGVGLAPLPTALGDAEPELVRVLGPIPELARMWRVLTTPELRRTPRVAALFDFVVDEIDALRPIITG
ncbi:MAG TPA: LysR family transcriptional regulator [Burkholderiaceae bacterium]|nr:LysR family transcriptional regulator [Burkholderiaceae bacterium]